MTGLEESLSALVDGECSAAELDAVLDACAGQPGLLRRYGRHCVVREVHAGRRVHHASEDLCAAVMRALDAPAPRRLTTRVRAPGRWGGHRRLRAAGGLALAASLGAVAALTVYRFAAFPTGMQAATTTVASAQAGGPDSITSGAGVHEVRWSQLDPRTTRRLDDYLMEHASYGSGQVMGGALNYARVAAQPVHYSSAGGTH